MKKDLRVKKSERAIRSAVLTLLQKKDITHITVNDICMLAEISRNTFYDHYTDKFHLIDEISKDFIRNFIHLIITRNACNNYDAAVEATAGLLFDYLSEHRSTVEILSKNNPMFWETFTDELTEFIITLLQDDDRTRIYATYSSGALINCYRDFFLHKLKMSEKKFIPCFVDIASKSNVFIIPDRTKN